MKTVLAKLSAFEMVDEAVEDRDIIEDRREDDGVLIKLTGWLTRKSENIDASFHPY